MRFYTKSHETYCGHRFTCPYHVCLYLERRRREHAPPQDANHPIKSVDVHATINHSTDSCRTYRKSKRPFSPRPPGPRPCRPFSPAARAAPPARRCRPPERPGAQEEHGAAWLWLVLDRRRRMG